MSGTAFYVEQTLQRPVIAGFNCRPLSDSGLAMAAAGVLTQQNLLRLSA
jgi:hypothetical protein